MVVNMATAEVLARKLLTQLDDVLSQVWVIGCEDADHIDHLVVGLSGRFQKDDFPKRIEGLPVWYVGCKEKSFGYDVLGEKGENFYPRTLMSHANTCSG